MGSLIDRNAVEIVTEYEYLNMALYGRKKKLKEMCDDENCDSILVLFPDYALLNTYDVRYITEVTPPYPGGLFYF